MERLGYWPRRGGISPIIKVVSRQPSQCSNGASSTFRVITGAETCACQRPGPGDSSGQTGLWLAKPGGRGGPLALLWPPRTWVPAGPQGHQMSIYRASPSALWENVWFWWSQVWVYRIGGETETGGFKFPVGWVVPGLPELCQAHEVESWRVVWGHNRWGCAVNILSSYP